MSFWFKQKVTRQLQLHIFSSKKEFQNYVVFVNVDKTVIPPGLITVDVGSLEVMKDRFLCIIEDVFIHVFICSVLNKSYFN